MKKVSMKEMMMEVIRNNGKEVDGVFEITQEAFIKVTNEIEKLGKFSIISNKKDDTLKAVAYTSKKSERLAVIKLVKESKKQQKSSVSIKTNMMKDEGLVYHKALVEIETSGLAEVDNAAFVKFVTTVNDYIKKESAEFLCCAELSEDVKGEEGKMKGYVLFPKVKGHSKDGYALYKKCMTLAKREMKTLRTA